MGARNSLAVGVPPPPRVQNSKEPLQWPTKHPGSVPRGRFRNHYKNIPGNGKSSNLSTSLSMSPFYRLYKHFESWRVDRGDLSDPLDFDEVIISCPASTNEDGTGCWLEVYDAVLREEDGVGYLELEPEKEI